MKNLADVALTHDLNIDNSVAIMVVDDDSLVTTLMTLSLQELGFDQIIEETSGEGALARLDANQIPAVIFCDLQMPGMDGVELIRHLGARHYTGGVILLSGTDWRILKSCEAMGTSAGLNMLGILQKPFAPNDIARLLSQVKSGQERVPVQVQPITQKELEDGLSRGEITAWYQPQIDVKTRSTVGMEVLARWAHPTRGFVPPLSFITLAEAVGLIDDVLKTVCCDALHQLGQWRALGLTVHLSLNLSARNLHDRNLPEQMMAWCNDARVDPTDVVIEITESQLAQNMALAQEILSRLRLKGFSLSIDDFGTGYSSLAQLHQLPFTELKVDRAFVNGAVNDARSRAIFESNVMLARRMGLVSVGEGVETEEDFALALELGCDVVQGYLFSPAMPAAAMSRWLERCQ
jgi:EAL domain-containing protein (putative c-di-GMP-specific phosphodiesterase class I)/FixJ family two-component response regulator